MTEEKLDSDFSDVASSVRKSAKTGIPVVYFALGVNLLCSVLEGGLLEGSTFQIWIGSPVIWIVLTLHLGAMGILAWRPEIGSDFYFKYRDLKDSHRRRDASIAKLSLEKYHDRITDNALRFAYRAAIRLTEEIREKTSVSADEAKKHINEIMLLIVKLRESVFSFAEKDKWSFAVYMYNSEADMLECFFRRCDIGRAPTNRSWRPPDGHVGQCFAQRKAIVTEDVNAAHIFQDYQADESDKNTYVSMASAPIRSGRFFDKSSEVIGVLVITSSRSGQFERKLHQPKVEDMAFLLSMYFTIFLHKSK
jgi:hypothetical protein